MSRPSIFHLSCCLLGILSMSAITSQAQNTAITLGNSISGGNAGNYSVGWEFTVNSNITLTQLGYWDQEGNGFVSSHQVGLFSDAGTLLTSTTVASSDPLTAE